jgi:diguanylate cyclase (GGDEF)-like protein/PAS domain S-box-containing protein
MLYFIEFFKNLFGNRTGRPDRDAAVQASHGLSDTSFQLLAESSADVILRIGPDLVADYVSPSSLRVFGWAPEEMVGRNPDAFIFPEDLPSIVATSRRKFAGKGGDGSDMFRIVRKDGTTRWVEGNAQLIYDPVTGKPGDLVLIIRDTTERKRLEEKLSAMALTDGLTGLANRRAFDQALEQEWQRTLRDGTQMSLLLLDLDNFKGFNDQYGHQVGDDCLRAVAVAVQGAVRRPGDLAARYGGEELVVILPNTDAAGALQVAEQIRAAIEALRMPHLANPEGGGWVTASIGASTALCRVGGTMRMPESLLAAADTALYKAKHNGRNSVASTLLLAPDESSQAS